MKQVESPYDIVEGAALVGREEIERMKSLLDRMLDKITEKKKIDNGFDSLVQKIDRLDERVRNVETLLETAVNLIQELIFVSAGETLMVKEEQASVKPGSGRTGIHVGERT